MPNQDPDAEVLQNALDRAARDLAVVGKALPKITEWPLSVCCRFIEPGLVHYQGQGTVLVQRPALDDMAQSYVGKPVINEVHLDTTQPDIFEKAEADGIVTRVWLNPEDGWYWCEFLVWDNATKLNVASPTYSVSCAYKILELNTDGGTHNNIPYDAEILKGRYTHLSVVSNPRYEGARIVFNSKGGNMWKLFGKSKKEEIKNSADAVTEIDGKVVPIKDLIDLHNSLNPPTKTKEVHNEVPRLQEDDVVEIDGKEMPLKNLVNMYREKKNADEAADKKKKEDEAKNAEDEEKKKKDEEAKNAEEAEKKKKDDEVKNAADAEAKKKFDALKNSAESRNGSAQQPIILSRREQAAEGAKRYGSQQ